MPRVSQSAAVSDSPHAAARKSPSKEHPAKQFLNKIEKDTSVVDPPAPRAAKGSKATESTASRIGKSTNKKSARGRLVCLKHLVTLTRITMNNTIRETNANDEMARRGKTGTRAFTLERSSEAVLAPAPMGRIDRNVPAMLSDILIAEMNNDIARSLIVSRSAKPSTTVKKNGSRVHSRYQLMPRHRAAAVNLASI